MQIISKVQAGHKTYAYPAKVKIINKQKKKIEGNNWTVYGRYTQSTRVYLPYTPHPLHNLGIIWELICSFWVNNTHEHCVYNQQSCLHLKNS